MGNKNGTVGASFVCRYNDKRHSEYWDGSIKIRSLDDVHRKAITFMHRMKADKIEVTIRYEFSHNK